jgi:4-hydroxythreonine-4-phosphate dehydrogenase
MKRIAITLGDCNGVGPEIALRAASACASELNTRFVLIGSSAITDKVAQDLNISPPPVIASPGAPTDAPLVVFDPDPGTAPALAPGTITAEASQHAVRWIEEAVRGCMEKTYDAMVTAPICKEGLLDAGFSMPGHTEYLAELTGTERFAMMLLGGPLRVVLATRHVPLRNVAAALSPETIREAIEITAEALPWLGLEKGLIGVAGLNPHAGDGGAIGTEELEMIAPVINEAIERGLPVEGPVPPDVLFHKAFHGRYAAVVAMYHDQGLGPLKMIAFDKGVNLTLGLPIVRTSPDHGTAFDIAGKYKADPSSMVEAVHLAAGLSGRPNPWKDA